MEDKQRQQPWTVSQIKNEKPPIPTTKAVLTGFIGNSMNGGHNKTIFWKQIMAGEKHREFRLKMNIQMLTPKTPTYQNLKMTIRTYFVPNSRVWDNAEKFTAQKGGSSEVKIEEMPNIGGKLIKQIYAQTESAGTKALDSTQIWRDSFISSYIPRISKFESVAGQDAPPSKPVYPKINVLPLRGRIAIYNDYERNKLYDSERQEYRSDTVSDAEWNSYNPTADNDVDFYTMRAKRENNYYTDYRTEYQGFESEKTGLEVLDGNQTAELVEWASWESKIAEARSQAENAQENDWNIIAKLRGSKLLTEGKVQLIGKKTFNLNYSAVTQSAYNTNESIAEEFQVMGKQGAYSYTEVNVPIFAGMEFNEEGFIHVIATVSADTVFESAIDRTLMNVSALDMYRPELKDDKLDVLYEYEMGTNLTLDQITPSYFNRVVGYKRRFSEYLKMPNVIGGDLTTNNYNAVKKITPSGGAEFELAGEPGNLVEIITNKTFQFYEIDATNETGGEYIQKRIWKDYTDLLINKNQAIKNTIYATLGDYTTGKEGGIMVQQQNQIYFMGEAQALVELPIDSTIAGNYTKWGEH